MLETNNFLQEENQQSFPKQSRTHRPLRPYQTNRPFKELTITNEEDTLFQLPNNSRNVQPDQQDQLDADQPDYNSKSSFLKRNLAQTTRNDAFHSNNGQRFTDLYEDQDNDKDTAPENGNYNFPRRTSNILLARSNAPNSTRPQNMTSMNARAKLAEQQKLRQAQPKKTPDVEYFTLEQILAQAEAKKAHARGDSMPSGVNMFHDPSEKTMKAENLPELRKEISVIGSRFDEVQLDMESHVEETHHQVIIKHNPIKEVRAYQPQQQEQQKYVPLNSPLAASRESANEFFASMEKETRKFEEELPIEHETEIPLPMNKSVQSIAEKKEDANEGNNVQTASSPAQAFESPMIFKAILKDLESIRVFLMSPCPKGQRMQCSVRRDRSGLNRFYPKYHCLLSDGLQYMMTAKKRAGNRTSNYIIGYTQKDIKKNSQYCLGKLRSNFLGTEFNIFDQGENPAKTRDINGLRSNLGVVTYEENVVSGKGPRKKKVYLPEVDPRTNEPYQFKPLNGRDNILYHWKNGKHDGIKELLNKKPYWSDEHQTYILDYGGRAKLPSIKNFQLIDGQNDKHIFLQFGKNTENTYILDFEWPLSPFQAFAICLTSFDYKIACE